MARKQQRTPLRRRPSRLRLTHNNELNERPARRLNGRRKRPRKPERTLRLKRRKTPKKRLSLKKRSDASKLTRWQRGKPPWLLRKSRKPDRKRGQLSQRAIKE